jgi:uroporphyrin-III C-methyltransferase
MPHDEIIRPGEVWLVGAGPGDPDLITRKAEKLICAASVIFHDALVGRQILELAQARTKLISVGKRSGRHSKDQQSINDLLLEAALAGERVVRLKGGDPSIFGRSGEELAYLAAQGIRARVCPGITAASAAAASAGVSLTLRGLARRLEFVTAHARAGEEIDLDWDRIADSGATLCVYMGKAAAGDVARKLMKAGLNGSTPVLAVENASLANEHIFSTRLDLMPLAVKTAIGDGPAVLLIGQAVAPACSLENRRAPSVAPARPRRVPEMRAVDSANAPATGSIAPE